MMAPVEQPERARAPVRDELGKPLVARQRPPEREFGRSSDWERKIAHRSHLKNDASRLRLGHIRRFEGH